MERTKVDLSTLSGGAANDYFAEAMKKVLENIEDVNTSPTAVRGITLTIKIKPSEDRMTATTVLDVTTKLATIKPYAKSMFFSRESDGELCAYEENIQQNVLPFNEMAQLAARG